MSYFSTPEKKSFPLKVGVIFLALAALGSVAAANVTINNGARFEFGQTVYKVQACSGWVSIAPSYGAGDLNGVREGSSRITGITFSGIDPSKCLSTNLTFKIIGSDQSQTPILSPEVLDLYSNDYDGVSNPANEVVLSVDEYGNVYLLDSDGSYIADGGIGNECIDNRIGNDFIWLENDPDYGWACSSDWTGEFFVYFEYPLAYMSDLHSVTVETGANGL